MPQPYPHLLPAESILWAMFLQAHGREWDRFEYDVRVGKGRPIDPNLPPEIQRMAATLTPKRIDVVGYLGSLPTIFEVSPRGGRALVGALHLYQWLYHEQYPSYAVPSLVAVVGRVDPDGLRYLQAQGVQVFVMGDGALVP